MGTRLYQDERRDDVRRRLFGSVCMYAGRPVYVRGTSGSRIEVSDLITGDRKVIDHTDEKFDYRSPQLGYMNWDRRAYYLTRIPSRDNGLAGISQNNVLTPDGRPVPVFATVEMGQAILGEHPNYQTAVTRVVDEDWESCAFHRHMCVVRLGLGFGLHYRDRLVGVSDMGRVRLLQTNESSFLDRIVRKQGVEVV